MAIEDDPRAPKAEEHLWAHYRRAMERSGQGDQAIYLRHQARARPASLKEEGGLTTIGFDMHLRASDYSLKLNPHDGGLAGWQFPLLAENPGRDLMPSDILVTAQEAATPPAGAVLAYSRYEEVAGRPVFVARWHHIKDGVPVERDFIHVLVNGKSGRVFGLFRKWHDVDYEFSER
jgi:hypothetical protein